MFIVKNLLVVIFTVLFLVCLNIFGYGVTKVIELSFDVNVQNPVDAKVFYSSSKGESFTEGRSAKYSIGEESENLGKYSHVVLKLNNIRVLDALKFEYESSESNVICYKNVEVTSLIHKLPVDLPSGQLSGLSLAKSQRGEFCFDINQDASTNPTVVVSGLNLQAKVDYFSPWQIIPAIALFLMLQYLVALFVKTFIEKNDTEVTTIGDLSYHLFMIGGFTFASLIVISEVLAYYNVHAFNLIVISSGLIIFRVLLACRKTFVNYAHFWQMLLLLVLLITARYSIFKESIGNLSSTELSAFTHIMLQVTPVYLIALICMSVAHYCSRVYIKVLVSLIVVILALYLNGIILGSGSNAIKLFSAQLGQIFDKNVFVLLDEILTYFVSIVGLLRLVTTILLIVIVKNIFWNKNALKLTIKRITFYFILILSLVGVYAYMLTNESEYDQQFVGSIGIGNNVENTDFSKLSASSTEVFTKAKGLNSQKNVVVLMVDSLSSFKSALYGGDNLMPQLDAIAKDNVYFSNFYAPSYNNEIALEQFFTGKPYLHNNSDLASKNYYETTIPKEMKNHGYQSFVMYSSDISETEEIQLKNVGFDFTVDHLDEYYTSAHQRYDRNSIDTKVFLDHAAQRIEYWIRDSKYKKNTMKVFVTLIASFSASPYLVPVELRNNPQALEYDLDKVTKFNDDAIANFVRTLENQGFFKDGILIITGNYRAQVPVTQKEFDKYGQAAAIRVPCIIIDKSLPINVHEYKNDISALSLSEIIYYLTLDTYRSSSMRVNPFVDKYDNELIIYQKSAPRNEIFLKKGDTTGRFLINGNRSKIVGNLQDKQTNFGDVLYLLKEKVYNDDVPLKQENIELIEEQIQPKEDNKVIEQSSETTDKEDNKVIEQSSETTDKEDLGESLVLVESSENVVVQETSNDQDDEKYKEDEKEPEVIETNESSDEVKNAEVLQVTESSEGQEFSESVVVQESEASSSEE